jgi:hypothetical protein
MLWEPSFSAARPALTQMDLARQMRFRSRHVDQRELQMLPAMLYREYLAKSRERPPPPPSSHDKDEQIFWWVGRHRGGGQGRAPLVLMMTRVYALCVYDLQR